MGRKKSKASKSKKKIRIRRQPPPTPAPPTVPPPPDSLSLLALLSFVDSFVSPTAERRRRASTIAPHVPGRHPLFDAALCRFCRENYVQRRDVCQKCRKSQKYRDATRDAAQPADHLYSRHQPRPPRRPTIAPPGSDEKLTVMIERVARGEAVDHPRDTKVNIFTYSAYLPKETPADAAVSFESLAAKEMVKREGRHVAADERRPIASGTTSRHRVPMGTGAGTVRRARRVPVIPWEWWLPDATDATDATTGPKPSVMSILAARATHCGEVIDSDIDEFGIGTSVDDGFKDVSLVPDDAYCFPVSLLLDDEDSGGAAEGDG